MDLCAALQGHNDAWVPVQAVEYRTHDARWEVRDSVVRWPLLHRGPGPPCDSSRTQTRVVVRGATASRARVWVCVGTFSCVCVSVGGGGGTRMHPHARMAGQLPWLALCGARSAMKTHTSVPGSPSSVCLRLSVSVRVRLCLSVSMYHLAGPVVEAGVCGW